MATAGAVRAGRAYVELFADNTRLMRGLRAGERALRQYGQNIRSMGLSLARMTAFAAAPAVIATGAYAKFADQMAEVRAVTQAQTKDFERLYEQAKKLGRETSFTAVQVAGVQTELGRAGFNPQQILDSTPAAMDLARATRTDAPQTAGIMAATLRQFELDATEATRVADALTQTANRSFNTLETIGETLQYAGPVAKDFGMTLEETLALVGVLGNVGIQGSSSGTAIRRMLTVTAADADRLKKIFGVEFKDAAGNARPLVDVLDEVNEATKDLGTAERGKKFKEAFSLLGITSASAIGRAAGSARELLGWIEAAGGKSRETAQMMDDTIGGSLRMLWSAAEGVAIAIGEALDTPLRSLIDSLTASTLATAKWIDANRDLVVTVGIWIASLGALSAALITVGSGLGVASFALGGFNKLARLAIGNTGSLIRLFATFSGLRLAGGLLGGMARLPATLLAINKSGKMALGALLAPATGLSRVLRGLLMPATQVGVLMGGVVASGISVVASVSRVAWRAVLLLNAQLIRNTGAVFARGLTSMAGAAVRAVGSLKALLSLQKAAAGAKAVGGAATAGLKGLLLLATNPVLLTAGAAAGIAYLVSQSLGGFDAIMGGARTLAQALAANFDGVGAKAETAWLNISTAARRSFDSIVARIQAGDLRGAWNVTTSFLRLTWAETVNAFVDQWAPVKVALEQGWRDTSKLLGDIFGPAIETLKETWGEFATWFLGPDGGESVSITWSAVVTEISKAWAKLIVDLKNQWAEFKAGFKNLSSEIGLGFSVFHSWLTGDKQIAETALQDANRAQGANDAEAKGKVDSNNNALKEQLKTIDDIGKLREERERKRVEDEKKKAADNVDAARKEHDAAVNAPIPGADGGGAIDPGKLITQPVTEFLNSFPGMMMTGKPRNRQERGELARQNRLAAAAESGDDSRLTRSDRRWLAQSAMAESGTGTDTKALPAVIARFQEQQNLMRSARAGLDFAAAGTGASVGTFSGRAASMLGASSVLTDIKTAVEETAANTAATNDKLDNMNAEWED